MNYHDTHFARRMGETPLRPDYANAIERPMDKGDRLVMVACIAASIFMGILFIAEYLK